MRIRYGFISNSSSSSFIVENINLFPLSNEDNKPKLTKKEIKKLKNYGFYPLWHSFPSRLLEKKDEEEEVPEKEYNFGYYISCNQDEVLTFLLKNKIPFKASIHYGNYHAFYDRESDVVIIAQNFGLAMEMYEHNRKGIAILRRTKKLRFVKVNEYLEGEDWI